jgi:tetratricopeptide (TPR) repeat protein
VGFYYLVEDVRLDEAVRHLQRSLELREQLGDARVIPSGLVGLGEAELVAGHPEQAVELLGQALLMARQAGLLAERINDAERALHDARAMLATQQRETKPSER